jgi:hypothetical protein
MLPFSWVLVDPLSGLKELFSKIVSQMRCPAQVFIAADQGSMTALARILVVSCPAVAVLPYVFSFSRGGVEHRWYCRPLCPRAHREVVEAEVGEESDVVRSQGKIKELGPVLV